MNVIIEPIIAGEVTEANFERVLSWTQSDLAVAVRKSLAARVGISPAAVNIKVQPRPPKRSKQT